ncbi:MAG: helix-turn-helix domain-containing protein [Bacteroidota bacterium]
MPFSAAVDTYLLFFFSGLGVFNGLILAIYFLFVARPWHISNGLMGGLLLALSLRVGKSIFFHFNDDLAEIYIQIGLTGCVFIGPFLYFYVRSMLRPPAKMPRAWIIQLAGLLGIMVFLGIRYPYWSHLYIWRGWLIDVIYFQWMLYLIAAGLSVAPLLGRLFKKGQSVSFLEFWICNVYLGTSAIWLAFITSSFTSYISGAIAFSVITYLLILWYAASKKKKSVLLLGHQPKRKVATDKATELLNRLTHLMETEAPYQNPKLKSRDLAEKLNVGVHDLSALLNEHMGKRFSEFVNEYRIQRAREIMQTHPEYTLEAIGYEAGFNSKSTFYTAFKQSTGTTPARYLKDLQKGPKS